MKESRKKTKSFYNFIFAQKNEGSFLI